MLKCKMSFSNCMEVQEKLLIKIFKKLCEFQIKYLSDNYK